MLVSKSIVVASGFLTKQKQKPLWMTATSAERIVVCLQPRPCVCEEGEIGNLVWGTGDLSSVEQKQKHTAVKTDDETVGIRRRRGPPKLFTSISCLISVDSFLMSSRDDDEWCMPRPSVAAVKTVINLALVYSTSAALTRVGGS